LGNLDEHMNLSSQQCRA